MSAFQLPDFDLRRRGASPPPSTWKAGPVGDNGTLVAAEGVAPDGEPGTLLYAPRGERGHPHHLALIVNGGERESGSGFDIPGTTEIGFGGGLKPGEGNYYLYDSRPPASARCPQRVMATPARPRLRLSPVPVRRRKAGMHCASSPWSGPPSKT